MGRGWKGSIYNIENNGGSGYELLRPTIPFSFHRIVGFSDASSVNHRDRNPIEINLLFYRISSCTGYICNNRTVFFEKPVKQTGFSHIGLAGYGDNSTFTNNFPAFIRKNERFDVL